jgi:hypothetical protein
LAAAVQAGVDRFERAGGGPVPEKENHNKRTVLRLYEEVGNEGRLEVLDEIAWPDHVEHYPFPGQSQGVAGLKQRVSMVRAAFNPQFTIEHLVAATDVAAFAVAAAGNERACNRVLVLGGPQPVTWHDVVAAYERVVGHPIEIRYLPRGEGLPGYPDFISGFMNLLEGYDSVIPMDSLAREFDVRQVSLDESIHKQLEAAATP